MMTLAYDPATTELIFKAATPPILVGATFTDFTVANSLTLEEGFAVIGQSITIESSSDLTLSPDTSMRITP